MAKKKKRKLKKRVRRFIRYGIFALLVCVFLFSAVSLVRIAAGYIRSRHTYDSVASAVMKEQEEAAMAPEPEPDAEEEAEPSQEEPAETELPKETAPVAVDWEALKSLCPDAVGWLYSPDTPINYPVVRGADNDRYLTHAASGENSSGGALFMDCRADAGSQNVVVYGHRMKDRSMFGTLPGYAEKAYYAEHPVLYFLTPDAAYRADVYACRTVSPEWKYFSPDFASEAGYEEYTKKAVVQSYWAPLTPYDPSKRTLTLVTCSTYTHESDPRLLVHAFLTEIG